MAYASIEKISEHNYIFSFSTDNPSEEEFDEYLQQMTEIYAKHDFVSFIFDASKIKFLKAELRIKQGNWLKTHKEMIAAKQVGAAFVLPNFMTKLIFDAILLVQKLPMPYKVFSNL